MQAGSAAKTAERSNSNATLTGPPFEKGGWGVEAASAQKRTSYKQQRRLRESPLLKGGWGLESPPLKGGWGVALNPKAFKQGGWGGKTCDQ